MCHVAIYRLVILPIDKYVLIGDIGQTLLGPQFLDGLVKFILAQSVPWASLHHI